LCPESEIRYTQYQAWLDFRFEKDMSKILFLVSFSESKFA